MEASTTRKHVRFEGPRNVAVVETPVPQPDSTEVLVRTICSGISPGTERLIYRGNAPESLQADASLPSLEKGSLSFPLSYGYACVGRVESIGSAVEAHWQDQRVFGFQPHASHFTCQPEDLVPLPSEISDERAVFLPSMETALSLVMDGRPVIGERTVVFGAGVIGLLTLSVLAQHPVEPLLCVEPKADRQRRAQEAGATEVFSPSEEPQLLEALNITSENPREAGSEKGFEGADLVYELSGTPAALNTALACVGYAGRVVVGSWYGRKATALNLGGRFHRSRAQLVSSQVSTIAPEYRGRWSKSRRLDTVLSLLSSIEVESLITHRFPIDAAPEAYEALDQRSEGLLQPVLEYGSTDPSK